MNSRGGGCPDPWETPTRTSSLSEVSNKPSFEAYGPRAWARTQNRRDIPPRQLGVAHSTCGETEAQRRVHARTPPEPGKEPGSPGDALNPPATLRRRGREQPKSTQLVPGAMCVSVHARVIDYPGLPARMSKCKGLWGSPRMGPPGPGPAWAAAKDPAPPGSGMWRGQSVLLGAGRCQPPHPPAPIVSLPPHHRPKLAPETLACFFYPAACPAPPSPAPKPAPGRCKYRG